MRFGANYVLGSGVRIVAIGVALSASTVSMPLGTNPQNFSIESSTAGRRKRSAAIPE